MPAKMGHHYPGIGMSTGRADEIWHAFLPPFEKRLAAVLVAFYFALGLGPSQAACTAELSTVQASRDPALCAALYETVRKPGALSLDRYEERLGQYLRNFCYRDTDGGWRSDKRMRATGPFTTLERDGVVTGHDFGTHSPVVVWYSPDMLAWLEKNRAMEGDADPEPPVPDGAILVKEMYPAPASACADADVAKLMPNGAAIMVRDSATALDGWFWGWFGWDKWAVDWPAPASSPYPNMGFGQYCVNCHASARANQTFSSLRNIKGEPGEPLTYLSQNEVETLSEVGPHQNVAQPVPVSPLPAPASKDGAESFRKVLGLEGIDVPELLHIKALPPATYDNVWARPKGHPLNDFVTSNQCLGCHDAGSTGLQFDMTERQSDGHLVNLSPFGTWRSSPMGMAGRDPIFFAQLASETDRFHPESSPLVQDTCLGCHGILGQRAFETTSKTTSGVCRPMSRAMLDATPFPGESPVAALADYAGLARDGVSCVACHRAVFGAEAARVHNDPQNACLDARRTFLTPGLTGFAATFTGSFDMGAGDVLKGPFKQPRELPMKHALGMAPAYDANIGNSELCGSCHTVHLPILDQGRVTGHTYEQTTYAEWAFSDYRTGTSPDQPLPLGPGAKAQSCQGCHMPSTDAVGHPVSSKIASIQELSSFPATENVMAAADIDLPSRAPYARHTLVGLNLVFVKMAQLFPALLGIPKQDPMLANKGEDSLVTTERAMRDQASHTATVAITDVVTHEGRVDATVVVTNHAGHKFPSGVGFRRAFVEFIMRDAGGRILWSSGQTNQAGVLLDGNGNPLDGELWWRPDCSARIDPDKQVHQPHYETIRQRDQVQIYEDLAASAGGSDGALCTKETPTGPLTTSFLSRCVKVKDNRILPSGFLSLDDRSRIAAALGADKDLAEESGAAAVGDDPDYRQGGGDTLHYVVALDDLSGRPASVEAALYYQATPPYYLQDRACTSGSQDTKRLMFMTTNLGNEASAASVWKLKIATSGPVAVR
jgi:hypothetical protein